MFPLIFPYWLIRFLITVLIIWLVWALFVSPWIFSTRNFIETRYDWMLPGKEPETFFGF